MGHVAYVEQKINVYGVLVGNPEGKGLLGRLRHRWEDNIEMDHKSGMAGHKLDSFIWLKLGTSGRLL